MTRELNVSVRGLASVGAGFVVPSLDIVVYRSDGAPIRDQLSPTIGLMSDGVYIVPAAVNALMMTAVKTFLADPAGWNIPNAYDAEYLTGGASVAASVAVIKKTADTAFTSATPADVPMGAAGAPALAFAVSAGVLYRFSFDAVVRSDTATVGVAMSVTFPSATIFAASGRFAGAAADGTDAEWVGNITASDDAVIPQNTIAVNTDYIFSINGILLPSSSGVLTLRARTETGTTNVTVRRGTHGMLWALGPG